MQGLHCPVRLLARFKATLQILQLSFLTAVRAALPAVAHPTNC